MSFRRRMVLLAAAAVAVAVVIASVVVYVVTRDELRGQLDASLRAKLTPGKAQAVQVQLSGGVAARAPNRRAVLEGAGKGSAGPLPLPLALLPGLSAGEVARAGSPLTHVPPAKRGPSALGVHDFATAAGLVTKVTVPESKAGEATGYVQLVQAGDQVVRSTDVGPGLPIDAAARAVAAGKRPAFFSDATIGGIPVRVFTARAPIGDAVFQAALPLGDLNNTLSRLRLLLALVCLAGVGLAAALGLLVSRAALVPVRRLTRATERIARTDDLAHRIDAHSADELGQLAASFDAMLAALERSRLAQRQLVSDASHELRTPLTSVRANLDALASGALGERDGARAIAAARAQLQELTVLVGDLVDLSKTTVEDVEVEDVRLDLAVETAVRRARLHAPRCRFVVDAHPCLVRAAPARLDRAIANLLDNACKWSPPGWPIEVHVRGGLLRVRDHGVGISPRDLPRVFDRFYRAPDARGLPGSGLGLAIVRQVAETHGGTVDAENDPDGGARLTLELPELAMTAVDVGEPRATRSRAALVHEAPRVL